MTLALALTLLLDPTVAAAAPVARAPAEPLLARRTPFEAGSIHLSLGSSYSRDRYLVIAAGLGYYVLDGLELGLDVEHWFGNEPTVTRLSPQLRYTLYWLEDFPPYVGAFYRRWMIDGEGDLDSVGLRAGAYVVVGRSASLAIGVGYEQILGCGDPECQLLYPEFILGIGF